MIIGIVVLALVIAAVVWFVRSMTQPGHQLPATGGRSPGLDALEERYARGEIKREEYLEKKRDIELNLLRSVRWLWRGEQWILFIEWKFL